MTGECPHASWVVWMGIRIQPTQPAMSGTKDSDYSGKKCSHHEMTDNPPVRVWQYTVNPGVVCNQGQVKAFSFF